MVILGTDFSIPSIHYNMDLVLTILSFIQRLQNVHPPSSSNIFNTRLTHKTIWMITSGKINFKLAIVLLLLLFNFTANFFAGKKIILPLTLDISVQE